MATPFFTFPTPADHVYPSESSGLPGIKRKRADSVEVNGQTRQPIAPRTIKRFRSRPNEENIYKYTIEKLFTASKNPVGNSPNVKNTSPPENPSASTSPRSQNPSPRRSSPWSFLRSPQSDHSMEIDEPTTHQQASEIPTVHCEDCSRPVQVPYWSQDWSGAEVECVGCHRVVCDNGCSRSNGEGRVCLSCVGYA